MRLLKTQKSWFGLLLLAAMLALALTGCYSRNSGSVTYLLRIDEMTVSIEDFKRFWEGYSAPIYANADISSLSAEDIRQTKLEAFDQFVIAMLLEVRAEDIGIAITNEELEAEITKLKEEYTIEGFRDTLIKAAMSYELWSESLKRRLLMEKVMRADLYAHGEITPEDVERYGGLHSGKIRGSAEEVLERVYRAKAEHDFQAWIKRLQQYYPVDINYDELAIVLNE